MSKLWLPGEPLRPVYSVRNWGEPWARNAIQTFGKGEKPPNGGGGGGGKGGSALGAPTNLAASANGSTQIDLTWTDNASGEGGFKVERSANGTSGWAQIGTNAANDTTYSDTGLTAETQYYYRVRAYNGSRNGAYSGTANATTAAAGPGSSPAGWWIADTGLEQTSGGTAATADTDPVGRWLDQSGNSYHLLQTTADNRPILKLSQINGKPCLRFDGSNDSMKALFTLNLSFQVFMVVNQISWTNGDYLIGGGSGDSMALAQNTSSPNIGIYGGNATQGNNNGLAVGSWGLVEATWDTVANMTIRVNQGTATTGQVALAGDRGGISLAAHNGGVLFANIDVAEVILYTSILTGANLTAVYTYLSGRYGL
jgi:hypothetical protein